MSTKEYKVTTNEVTAQPRSQRLRDLGITTSSTRSSNSVVVTGGGSSSTSDGHTHDNKSLLDSLSSDDNGYLYMRQKLADADESTTEKVKAGYADVAHELDETSSAYDTFLRKDMEDATAYLIKFLAGAMFGNFKEGTSGAQVDEQGNAEVAQLVTRLKATLRGLQVEGDAEFGNYTEGLSGGKIDSDGNAEFGSLLARLKATLRSLSVQGDSTFQGNLSSEEFVSGLLTGKGWAIFQKEVLNSLGVSEKKYIGEFDELVVRGAMRIYSMVISQLLGENDNRIFTGMMEVDHYDASSGRVYLSTQNGKLYNPFRVDDYIMVQQYNGMPSDGNYITKHYELIVTGAGCGSSEDGEERLDWVTFSNFSSADGLSADKVISKGDTFTRVDNATDADRKGLIQLMTVGSATPYLDVVYGMKTDPDNSLKGRLGNLSGINHPLFGWLDGFGELLTNLYAVGDFRLKRTGESVDSKIEALKGMFSTQYQRMIYDITEDDNYLKNTSFTELLDYWQCKDETKIITMNEEALLMNGSTYSDGSIVVGLDSVDGRNVLHIKNSYVKQLNEYIRKPETHKEYIEDSTEGEYEEVKDTLYLSLKVLVKTKGTLTVGFQGSLTEAGALPEAEKVNLTSSSDWQVLQWSGTWDGTGDFVLSYTGEMYVSMLSLTDKTLEEYKKETSTKFEQTDSSIRLLGNNINNLEGTVTDLGVELDAAEENIRIYADKYDSLNQTVTNLGVRLDAAEGNINIYADKYDSLNQTVTNLGIKLDTVEENISISAEKIADNETSISEIKVNIDAITSSVTSISGDLDAAKARIEAVAAVADAASDAETYNQASDPWNSWVSEMAWKHVGALWYNTSDGHVYRYIGYDNKDTWEDVTNIQSSASYVLQTKDKISTVVGSFDDKGNLVNTSGLVTTSYATEIYATITTVDEVSGRVSAAEALIAVHSSQIELRVVKGDVISSINQSAEEVSIDASRINFNGLTTINDSFRVEENGTTHIGGFVVSGDGLTVSIR
jgi:hypothetical protein